MRSKYSVFVNVVCVRTIPPRMILGEAKGVKVLGNGNNRMCIIVMGVDR